MHSFPSIEFPASSAVNVVIAYDSEATTRTPKRQTSKEHVLQAMADFLASAIHDVRSAHEHNKKVLKHLK